MTPEVAIVGGGVIGASVAWHLASRGCRDVLILDRGSEPGAGSTSRATGGYRAQFGSDINVRLSLMSREKLRRFDDEVGGDCGYRPVGYLFLARHATQLDALRRALDIQHAAGLAESHEVDVAEIARRNPRVSLDGVVGGTFCPSDGFIAPLGLLSGYLAAAQKLGVRVQFGVGVADLAQVRATWVVNAAGAWAGAFGVPVTPLRRQVLPTAGMGALSPDDPMTIWVDDGFHFRVRDGRALLLWPGGSDPADPFDTRVDPAWMDRVESLARERVPGLAGVAVDRAGAWAGLYEMSPDGHAILGRVANVVLVNGSSGHGVMHAPALGQLVAEIILDGRAHSIDVSPLRPSRFAEGCPVKSVELL